LKKSGAKVNRSYDRFRTVGLKFNPKKCAFAQQSCIFLGHHISSEGIIPPPDRVKALQQYPSPQNIKQLRRLLGLCSWFKKFIPQYSAIIQPMTKFYAFTNEFGIFYDVHGKMFLNECFKLRFEILNDLS
jgi:hypothetical protein